MSQQTTPPAAQPTRGLRFSITRATRTGWRICFGEATATIERASDGVWYLASGTYRGLTLGHRRAVAVRRLFMLATWE